MKTLLTTTEIIEFTGISYEFPKTSLRTIKSIELNEAHSCLGLDFYKQLLDDLRDFSDVNEYDNLMIYSAGNFVSYNGVIYEAIDTTQGNIPTNETFWKIADKFETNCFNTLWCEYLGEYLSWKVLYDRLPFIATQVKAEGIVKIFGQTFSYGNNQDIERLMKACLRAAERIFRAMDYYLTDDEDDCFSSFENYVGNQNSCEDSCDQSDYYGYNFG